MKRLVDLDGRALCNSLQVSDLQTKDRTLDLVCCYLYFLNGRQSENSTEIACQSIRPYSKCKMTRSGILQTGGPHTFLHDTHLLPDETEQGHKKVLRCQI